MTTHDIQLLLFDLALILVLARVFGMAARAIGQPPVVGEILAGILLGPTLFGGAIARNLFPSELRPPLSAIADVGLVLFMFIVGYEVDATLIRGRERVAASVSLGSIALPMAGGFGLGFWLATKNAHGQVVPFALFVGASMSVTAFPVLARILTDRGLHRTRIGGLAIASAAVGDIAAWALLAVVITIAGAPGAEQWHLLLAPVYLAIMIFGVRPLMKQVAERYRRAARLTPDVLAVVLIALLLSAAATEWLGVHFIFGAFICGAVMPRVDAASLRQSILERLEQVSVLLLLPVFFVIAGLAVNFSDIHGSQLLELAAILGVAIGAKFVGAYIGGRATGVASRQAGVLATLMNTRGLTEIVILSVGLQNHVIGEKLFTLMILMAVITTAMTGPLLRLIYPPRLVNRDLADAERAALAADADYRVLVALPTEGVDGAEDTGLVDLAIDLAVARRPAQVVIARLLPQQREAQLEIGMGMGTDLLHMTQAMNYLHNLAGRGSMPGVTVTVYSQFSEDVPGDLTRYIINADPDLVVLGASVLLTPHELMPRTLVRRTAPAAPVVPAAVAVHSANGADGDVALQVGVQVAVARGLPLLLDGTRGRRDRNAVSELTKRGIDVAFGDIPDGALVIGPESEPGTHLVAHARPDEEIDDIDEWAGLVTAGRDA